MDRKVKINSRHAARLQAWDKKYIWHPFTQHYYWNSESPLVVHSGRGVYFKDIHGKKFLDGVSSLWVNVLGHNHPSLNRALKKQLSKIAHSTFLGLSHPPAIHLAKKLAEITPGSLRRTFFSDSGATAVEVALKMAYQYWREKNPKASPVRREFLALKGSYHGDTLGAVSVGGIETFHTKFKPLLFKSNFAMAPSCYRCPYNKTGISDRYRLGEKVTKTPKPGQFRSETGCHWECLGDFQNKVKKKSKHLAAAIVEPVVQGASGIVVMPSGYMRGIENICRKNNVFLIVDEVATGFGRTGTMFASEQEGIRPDFLCMAKGLTGGYSPLAATITKESIFKVFLGPLQEGRTFFHGHSYTAHPLGAAVAVENIRVIEKIKLLEKTRQKAKLMKNELMRLAELSHVGSIRQSGLMAGIELVKNKVTKQPYAPRLRMGARVCEALKSDGIWLRPLGDVLVVMPPLVIGSHEIKKLIQAVKRAILHETET